MKTVRLKSSTVIILALLAVISFSRVVRSAPLLNSSDLEDVELLDHREELEEVDVLVIESSMVTPFTPRSVVMAGTGGEEETINFFWSGSGDDPDAGMTYWVTTTVTRTSLVTITTATAVPTTTTTTECPPIEPTPPVTPAVVVVPQQFWIRTVFRSDADESSQSFRHLIESRLHQLYAQNMQAGSNASSVQVVVQNISRSASGDVSVIYALLRQSPSAWLPVEPRSAVGILQSGKPASDDVMRDLLCIGSPPSAQRALCQSVITQAEPFMANDSSSNVGLPGGVVVSAGTTAAETYWIIGSVLGALLVLFLIILLVYLITRQKRRKKEESAEAEQPRTSATTVGMRSQGTATVEEDPDPWVRKSRSTLKRRGGHASRGKSEDATARHSRLRTAGPSRRRRNSTSSLSAMAYSGSSSAASPKIERLQYKLTREEPVQHSRGARRLKKKAGSSGRSSTRKPKRPHPNKDENKEDPSSIVTGSERPVVPKSLMVPSGTTGAEMETQEISADFSTDDDEEGEEDDAAAETKSAPAGIDAPSEVLRSRKVSSAPELGEHSERRGSRSSVEGCAYFVAKKRRGWVSSDQLDQKCLRPDGSECNRSLEQDRSLTEAIDDQAGRMRRPSGKRHPPLHIHSHSFPAWPSLSDTDPAIDLINTIKSELKKFDPPKT